MPMPYVTTLLAVGLLLLADGPAAFAQARFEALGGLLTPEIRVTVDDRATILRTSRVGIIDRPVVRSDYALYSDGGYGFAYQVPHLSFVTDTSIDLALDRRLAQRVLRFFDEDGGLVFRIDNFNRQNVTQQCVKRRGGGHCVVEIDLTLLPPIILDDVAQVDITVRSPAEAAAARREEVARAKEAARAARRQR